MTDQTPDPAPAKPPIKRFDYRTHVGPNEAGLHDQAVHAQQLPTDDGDPGRETHLPALPAAPAPTKEG